MRTFNEIVAGPIQHVNMDHYAGANQSKHYGIAHENHLRSLSAGNLPQMHDDKQSKRVSLLLLGEASTAVPLLKLSFKAAEKIASLYKKSAKLVPTGPAAPLGQRASSQGGYINFGKSEASSKNTANTAVNDLVQELHGRLNKKFIEENNFHFSLRGKTNLTKQSDDLQITRAMFTLLDRSVFNPSKDALNISEEIITRAMKIGQTHEKTAADLRFRVGTLGAMVGLLSGTSINHAIGDPLTNTEVSMFGLVLGGGIGARVGGLFAKRLF